MPGLYQELRRRNIFKVGIAYALIGWIILWLFTALEHALGWPHWTDVFFMATIFAGLPAVLLFAWAYEVTPEGMKKSGKVAPEDSIAPRTGHRLNQVIGIAAVIAGFFVLLDFYGVEPVKKPVIEDIAAALDTEPGEEAERSMANIAAPEAGEALARREPVGIEISAEFPFVSRYVEVLGSRMHYVEEGEGDPILFIHGNPTSSYLWRNVIPHVSGQGRAIAVDLIGMGKSDKPDLDYTFQDHQRYVDGFIEALALENITLVIHDWGSALGLDYASRHADNILGIAMMEAIIPPSLPRADVPAEGSMFYKLRDPETGPQLVLEENYFVEVILPGAVYRGLTEAEMEHYRAPYPDAASRKPTLVWPLEIPFGDGPQRNVDMVNRIGGWLLQTDTPILLFYANPGAIIPPEAAEWLSGRVRNIETRYLGPGYHFVQEDHPHKIGLGIADWRRRLLIDINAN